MLGDVGMLETDVVLQIVGFMRLSVFTLRPSKWQMCSLEWVL